MALRFANWSAQFARNTYHHCEDGDVAVVYEVWPLSRVRACAGLSQYGRPTATASIAHGRALGATIS